MARLEAVQLIGQIIANSEREHGLVGVAQDLFDELFLLRPDLVQRLAYPSGKRAWYCRRDSLHLEDLPWLKRGGDEFGNDTVCVRVPFAGQLVLVTTPRRSKIVARMSGAESVGADPKRPETWPFG